MVEESDLAGFVEAFNVIDGQLIRRRSTLQGRIERCIDIGKAARLQQMRASRTGFTPKVRP